LAATSVGAGQIERSSGQVAGVFCACVECVQIRLRGLSFWACYRLGFCVVFEEAALAQLTPWRRPIRLAGSGAASNDAATAGGEQPQGGWEDFSEFCLGSVRIDTLKHRETRVPLLREGAVEPRMCMWGGRTPNDRVEYTSEREKVRRVAVTCEE